MEAAATNFKPPTRHVLGLCGLLLAVVGLTLAIARPYVAEVLDPPPPPEPRQKLSETLAEAGEEFVDRMVDKVRGKAAARKVEPHPPARPWLLYLAITATSLGLAGSLAGTAGWIRREEPRLAGSAIALGAIAVAWTYIVAALVIALVIFFLLLLFGALGGTV